MEQTWPRKVLSMSLLDTIYQRFERALSAQEEKGIAETYRGFIGWDSMGVSGNGGLGIIFFNPKLVIFATKATQNLGSQNDPERT